MNNTQETVIFDPNQILGILDLRSLGYYKIKQGVLQQNLSKNYHFESVEKLCEEFNAIINTRKKEEEQEKEEDKYPWLDDSDERYAYSFNLYYMKGKDMILSDFCQDKK